MPASWRLLRWAVLQMVMRRGCECDMDKQKVQRKAVATPAASYVREEYYNLFT